MHPDMTEPLGVVTERESSKTAPIAIQS